MNDCQKQRITIEKSKKINFCESFGFIIDSKDLAEELKKNLPGEYNIQSTHACPFYIQNECTYENSEPSSPLFRKNYILLKK